MTIENIGSFKELELAKSFNKKRYSKLPKNLKNVINNMYGSIEDNALIHCKQLEGTMKPDLEFEIKGEKHYVSMKSGSNGIVHQENIFQLCEHLKVIGISEYTIDTIQYFHFGDGTLDGSGKKRYQYRYLINWLAKRIKYANFELNANRKFVMHIVNRCIFKGTDPNNILAEFVYNGDKEYGVIVSRKHILMHVKNNKYSYMDNLHIGPLIMHPHARYVDQKIKNVKRRNTIEFHWANYFTSLRKIAAR